MFDLNVNLKLLRKLNYLPSWQGKNLPMKMSFTPTMNLVETYRMLNDC